MTTKALKPIDELKGNIQRMEPEFKKALPPHMLSDKFVRCAMTLVQTNKDLQEADRTSVYAELTKAAQDGLFLDNREATLTTFNTKTGGKVAKYMPMVAGLLKKVRNSGELASITAQVVYKNDKFKFWVDGEGEHIIHEPNFFSDRGEPIGVFALAKTKDGGIYIEVLTVSDVQKIKSASRSQKNGPWSGAFELEMWKKSAIRRLYKKLPSSTDLDITMTRDDDMYDFSEPQASTPAKKQKTQSATPVAEETPAVSTSETIDVEAKPKGNTSKKSRLDKAMETQTEDFDESRDESYNPEQHFDDASGEFGEAPI